jgi:hypothetical protein
VLLLLFSFCRYRYTEIPHSFFTLYSFFQKTKTHSTMLFALVFTLLVAVVKAAPIPDGGSAYTGAGGTAVGGNKSGYKNAYGAGGLGDNADVLNLASDNAGDGGKANSGNAFGGDGNSG